MTTQGVEQLRPLTDQQNAGVEREGPRLSPRRFERHLAKTIGRHLSEADLSKLEGPRRSRAEVIQIAYAHRADEIAAAVHEEFPWLGSTTEVLVKAMRNSVRAWEAGFGLPPMPLDGPPDPGKSTSGRFVARQIGVPSVVLDARGEAARFAPIGATRGWSGAP